MDEKPNSLWRKSWQLPRSGKSWLLILALTGVFLAVISAFFYNYFEVIDKGAPSNGGWLLVTLLFSIIVSVVLLYFLTNWLYREHHFKRFFFVLACLFTLVALVYAVINWHGKHSLESFKREWEAKGEKFSYAELIPPPVPDDENFALTPVVASCYEEILDKTGHATNPRRTNVVNRLQMSRDGDDQKNIPTNSFWGRASKTDLALWQHYYRALADKTNLFAVPRQPQSTAADVLFALSKYDSTIEELRVASQLPYSRFPLEYNKDNPSSILLPHLAYLKRTTMILQLRAIAEVQNNQSDKALADVKLMLYLADATRTEPFLISHLVRIAQTDLALQPIYEGLADHKWTDAQLAALDAELARFDFLADYQYAMRGERILGMAGVDYLRRARDTRMFDYMDSERKPDALQLKSLRFAPSGVFYQNELAIAEICQQWILPMADTGHRMVSPTAVRRDEAGIKNALKHPDINNLFARLRIPALTQSIKRFAREQIAVDLARTAIALERFRLAHGDYPETLEALAPDFTPPHDLINGKPLNYRRTDDGQFVLYSVGWDEVDGGGNPGLTDLRNINYDRGDLVWRYPEK